jgi:hypothetical protein
LVVDADRPVTVIDLPVAYADRTFVAIAEMASVDRGHLKGALGSLAGHEDAIRRALDKTFTGF